MSGYDAKNRKEPKRKKPLITTCIRQTEKPAFFISVAPGTIIFYSVMILPLLPFRIIGGLFYGIGFLGLTPRGALAASIFSIKSLSLLQTSDSYVL